MARLPRLYAPQIPQLVQARFAQALGGAAQGESATALMDRLFNWLGDSAREHRVDVHGWCLVHDRLTLLATPPGPQALPKLVQALGRRYAAQQRQGRVFAERYRSALVEPGRWVLPALIWLESLPAQLSYVDQPESWPWSSAAGHTGAAAAAAAWMVDHPDYWKDGNTPFDRQARYRERLHAGLPDSQRQQIERALFGQWALGEPAFLQQLEAQASRRPRPAPRGRPRKPAAPQGEQEG
jgi:putative transposase